MFFLTFIYFLFLLFIYLAYRWAKVLDIDFGKFNNMIILGLPALFLTVKYIYAVRKLYL